MMLLRRVVWMLASVPGLAVIEEVVGLREAVGLGEELVDGLERAEDDHDDRDQDDQRRRDHHEVPCQAGPDALLAEPLLERERSR